MKNLEGRILIALQFYPLCLGKCHSKTLTTTLHTYSPCLTSNASFIHYIHITVHQYTFVWLLGEILCGGKKEVNAQFYSDLEETSLFYVVGVAEIVLA